MPEKFSGASLFLCMQDIRYYPAAPLWGKIKSQHRKSAFKHKSDGVFYNLYMGGKALLPRPFADLVLPGLKLGLYKANRLSPSRRRGLKGGRISLSEMKATSADAKSTSSAICSFVTWRKLHRSRFTTRSSFLSFQAS